MRTHYQQKHGDEKQGMNIGTKKKYLAVLLYFFSTPKKNDLTRIKTDDNTISQFTTNDYQSSTTSLFI